MWQERAACVGLWAVFDAACDRRYPGAARKALKVCRKCEVLDLCKVEHADEPYGVWGGMTPHARTRARKRAAKGVDSVTPGST